MDSKLILILAFGIFCVVFGGLATFSDSFNKATIGKKKWEDSEGRKFWTDQAVAHYSRYGIGLGTFICVLIVLGTLLLKYFQ
jgi:hypothetical protein